MNESETQPSPTYSASACGFDAILFRVLAHPTDGFYVMTPTVGGVNRAIAFDGLHIWVPNYGSSFGNTVSVLRANDGTLAYTATVGLGPLGGVAFDGANIWITNSGSGTVMKFRAIHKTSLPVILKDA